MRVLASASAARREEVNVTTPERRVLVATIRTSVTWDCAVIGLFDGHRHRHGVAVSAISGGRALDLALNRILPPRESS